MKIFIDTADIDEIKEAKKWGIVDGVTTNPTLIKIAFEKFKDKMEMEEYIREICRIVDGPVSLEVKGFKEDEMVKEAKILDKKFNEKGNVVIKIPISTSNDEPFEGIKAIKRLEEEGIRTNATLVMSPTQALLVARAGASYVSPFVGRIDDYIRDKLGIKYGKWDYYDYNMIKRVEEKMLEMEGNIPELYKKKAGAYFSDNGLYSGVEVIKSIANIYKAYNFKTKIIAASIRNARQVREIAEIGIDIATIPFNVLKEMIFHQKTQEGVKKFFEDTVEEYRRIFM
ncbi:MAG: transaldolase [Thermoplasmatales archaeon]|nr:transaldolase [Thermoplasmatales archaeon]